MALGTLHAFGSLSDFTDVFDDALTDPGGTLQVGRWTFDDGGSTGSGNTGPGSNNALTFVHTETSGGGDEQQVEDNGVATMAASAIPSQIGRTLRMRLCVQGTFGDASEGLRVNQRASDGDSWTQAAFIRGWSYSNSYDEGDSITDEAGTVHTCAADGGWIDFDIDIPDTAAQVQITPIYLFDPNEDEYTHDISVREVQWSWPDTTPVRAGSVLAPPVGSSHVAAVQPVAVRAGGVLMAPLGAVHVSAPQPPSEPLNVRDASIGHTEAVIEWDEPSNAGTSSVTGYEVRVGQGQWTSTGTSAPTHTFVGLSPATTYPVTVRAVNAAGSGPASVPFTLRTLDAGLADAPRMLHATPTGQRSIQLDWQPPRFTGGVPVTGYEVCVETDFAPPEPFRPTGTETRATVRGLAFGHRYGFRVRAVNSVGSGAQSDLVRETPRPTVTLPVPSGQVIPLEDVDRQSLIVRLADIDCRVSVWWNPTDGAWFGSLEAPANTPVVTGRRLVVNSGLLAGVSDVLPGDVVVRALDAAETASDPGRDAWRRGTHRLLWQSAS